MYFVTLEDNEGIFWDDPEAFETILEAEKYIAEYVNPPKSYEFVIYSGSVEKVIDPHSK